MWSGCTAWALQGQIFDFARRSARRSPPAPPDERWRTPANTDGAAFSPGYESDGAGWGSSRSVSGAVGTVTAATGPPLSPLPHLVMMRRCWLARRSCGVCRSWHWLLPHAATEWRTDRSYSILLAVLQRLKRACSSPPSCLRHTSHTPACVRACCVYAVRQGVCHRCRIVRLVAGVMGRPSSMTRWPACCRRQLPGDARAPSGIDCASSLLRASRSPGAPLTGRARAARARAVSTRRVAADRMAPRTVGPLHTMNRLDRTSCMMGACTVLTLLMWRIRPTGLPCAESSIM